MTIFKVSDDIYGIQLDEAGVTSVYLVDGEEPVLIETGTAKAVPRILEGMKSVGIDPAELRHAVIGHYHLDHAGGAAGLLKVAPDLEFYLHKAMVDWLTDHDRFKTLVLSSEEALGEGFDEMGAPETAVPEECISVVGDKGSHIDVGSTSLELIHTPGHSPDHLSVLLPEHDFLFANEAIGRYYPRTDVFHPPITIPSFDIEATRESINRLEATAPGRVALTHFGVRDDPDTLFETARRSLNEFTERIPALYDEHNENLGTTVESVNRELIGLEEGYPKRVASVQAEVCTRGMLGTLGRI